MANEKKLRGIKERILHSGSYIEKEAFELGIPKDQLLQELERMYPGGRNNSQYKAVITTSKRNASHVPAEELDKLRVLPKPTRQKASVSTPAPAPVPAPATPADTMEGLLRKKEGLQKELVTCATSLEKAEAILAIRQEALSDAQDVLEKAQIAVQQAEAEEAEAKAAVQQAQVHQAEAQQELQGIEQAIKELREKTIYLVDPWYSGELPTFGTFISTVEMEGVKTQEVSEDYLPEASLEGVLLFDFVPDYKKARVFCGLVAQFELEENPYHLIVSDERVKKLLKMYIGK